ncbi:hypothetical protein Aca07nite_28830 [Actinoplanes capillaceus]|uniref:Excreted virulence factor EspC, type VII ESX diderm n=1 Tax=Actinoplanes campanulatus TaxID=113559 RepID=A0ABQ3WHA3_9ACTN|nr:type VII secretion target [Actinoplanes capillaceus]GID45608.1 hypothetical protein Aca07nite_28830 [Actinoplanes capillaceus]
MNPDLEVDTESLRRDAAAVDDLAARVSGAAGPVPDPDPSPRWATTGAATLAAGAAARILGLLGTDVGGTAERIRASAEAYAESDDRAATRFRQTR